MKTTINVPFAVELNGPTGSSYVLDVSGVSCYGSAAKAKNLLREQLRARIAEALTRQENTGQRVLGCTDGTLLLVSYAGNGAWGYSIINRDHQASGGCIGAASFKAATEDAIRHAEQSYGGVAWQVRI